MTSFNSAAWLNFNAGKANSYRFAEKGSSEADYMKGLLNTAKGVISIFDQNNDQKQSLNEYLNSQRKYAELAMGFDTWDNDGVKERATKRFTERFNQLDVNKDGFIDEKELANELNVIDSLKVTGDRNDGSVGFSSLYCSSIINPEEKLAENYKKLFGE